MEPTEKNTAEEELILRLSRMPLKDVPSNLTSRIMLNLEDTRASFASRLWNSVSQPLTVSFRPLYAISAVLVVFGAFLLGRVSNEQSPEMHVSASAPLEELLAGPADAESVYLIGRGLLAAEQVEQAVGLLQKAASLEPANPEYALWEGIGYWSVGDRNSERKSYLRGLSVSPESVPLLTNLGHNYLSDGSYEEALDVYQAVMLLEPEQPAARYNSGLIFRRLERTQEEVMTWKEFLQQHRTGKWAYKAVDHLNRYGDFSYRTYRIGVRKVIVSPARLFDETLPLESRLQELATVAELLDRNPRLALEVVVFTENDSELARDRARAIRDMLETITQAEIVGRIGLSWFDSPEPAETEQGSVELAEGLLLFGKDSGEIHMEVAI